MTANGSDTQTQEHLDAHRPVILLRSTLIGAALALPLPGVGDMLARALSRGLIYHVARVRYVDIDDAAVDELLTETEKKSRLNVLSIVGGMLSLLRKRGRMRRLFAGLAVLRGVEEGARMFHIATLFDHYCARHHTGVVIHADEARRLRDSIDQSMIAALRDVSGRMLEHLTVGGLRLVKAVPTWAWAHLKHAETAPLLPVLTELAHEARGWLSDLSVRQYLGSVVSHFDHTWTVGKTGGSPPHA